MVQYFLGDVMDEVYHYLERNLGLNQADIVVLGCSGGPDSMALLSILVSLRKKTPFSIICAHVNHNVRKESAQEKEFLENWCQEHDISFESMTIEHYGDDNFHNEARMIRYRFFEGVVQKYQANYLMTAHHGDDLVETILMRLVRGSTFNGYAGFQREIQEDGYRLIRPLISVSKEEILRFNEEHHIPFVIDSSNEKDKYTRNRYRKYVLPFLREEEPKYCEKFLKFSRTLTKYSDYIDRLAKQEYKKLYEEDKKSFYISKFLEIDFVLQEKVLNSILASIYQDDLMLIHDRHVQLIYQLIQSKKKNCFAYLPNQIKVVKSYDVLSFQRESAQLSSYEIELSESAFLPNGKVIERVEYCETNGNDVCRLDSTDICLPLSVRTRKYGDRIALKGTNGHRKVKDVFIDCKIPMQERELWPIVVDATNTVVWIPGIKKSKFNKQKNEKYDIILKYDQGGRK